MKMIACKIIASFATISLALAGPVSIKSAHTRTLDKRGCSASNAVSLSVTDTDTKATLIKLHWCSEYSPKASGKMFNNYDAHSSLHFAFLSGGAETEGFAFNSFKVTGSDESNKPFKFFLTYYFQTATDKVTRATVAGLDLDGKSHDIDYVLEQAGTVVGPWPF